MRQLSVAWRFAAMVFQVLYSTLFTILGVGLLAYCLACALGWAEWLVFPLKFGAAPTIEAGWMVQTAMAVLIFGLAVFLPANRRILALETSHRRFSVNMKDIARAYDAVHRADRDGAFKLASEFDAVRERIAYLRHHPDLSSLEPDVLEVAAQMGVISRDMAATYSTEKVDRARAFLTQRQQEIDLFQERLEEAKIIANDIHNWSMRVELEEDVARSEIRRLRDMLDDALPEMNAAEHKATPMDASKKPPVRPPQFGLPYPQAAE